ncbi:hypothetical protein IAC76_05790 [Spirochaetes bacterium]|uniref:Uncharacterized protein n=1 Tax=Candidatus Scatousia excrementipullorum TaxID=2840936 RepID=A0A9D9GZK1_9BACT|nr:hypothetical protein [Candidatus Scatousia excrementipullorum]
MAISNIQETLLMYTKQKSMLNNQLSGVMFDLLNAAKDTSEVQAKYNDKIQEYYYLYMQDGLDETYYQEITEQLEKEREFELANLNSWETELELDKNNYETRLNEVTTFEATWTKLMQTNIKNDFTYGGAQQ